jgi:DNA polymerase I-like protein with 3'-5' exonuclease and polymerase domains
MRPSIVAFDFETTGLDYWNPNFRVLSCAFAWQGDDGRIKTRYLVGEEDIASQLKIIAEQKISLIAHNALFELGCILYRFPHIDDTILKIDTKRLVQCYDNGGKDVKSANPMSLEDELAALNGELKTKTGLGLESAVTRLLPRDFHNHKQPYYTWLRENAGVKKGEEGANLSLLPDEMLEAYNTMDAVVTLMLYNIISDKFISEGFDWSFDHQLHMSACKRIAIAKANGVKVDRERLSLSAKEVRTSITNTQEEFLALYKNEITLIDCERAEAWVNTPTTEAGKRKRKDKGMPEALKFNPGSTKQLAELFIDRLGIKPVFWTKESKASRATRSKNPDKSAFVPQPSMRAAHLPSYGEGGLILANLKKRQLVLLQENKLLALSDQDGRWHMDLNACGTKTGRYTGGGGLNIQALARKEKGLMGCLIPEDGYEFSSIDLSAGEPTVVAHYSGDVNYRAVTFDLVGREPSYVDGLLLLDDPYLSFASLSPLGSSEIAKAWQSGEFGNWVTDQESVKSKLKKIRALHKTLFLALMYGQGPRGMVNFSADQGVSLDIHTARETHHRFWNVLFPRVGRLARQLESQFERQGYLYNAFGYRMVPEQPRLALNYTIQSSVSGLMKILEDMFFQLAPWAHYVTTIHDETIITYPTDRREETKAAMQQATKQLNDYLQWSVEIRTGWATGNTLYEAK